MPCRPQLGPSAAAQTAPPPDLGAKMRAAMCEAQQRLAAAAAAAAALQPVPGVAARGQQQRSVQLQERVDEWEGRGARPQEEQQQSVECGAAHAKVRGDDVVGWGRSGTTTALRSIMVRLQLQPSAYRC